MLSEQVALQVCIPIRVLFVPNTNVFVPIITVFAPVLYELTYILARAKQMSTSRGPMVYFCLSAREELLVSPNYPADTSLQKKKLHPCATDKDIYLTYLIY